MKKIILTIAAIAVFSLVSFAEKQTVTLHVPSMMCIKCQGRIENVLAFEKGVRKLEFDLEKRTTTVTFEDKKTNVETLQAALKKHINYDSEVVKDCCKKDDCKSENKCENNTSSCCQGK